MITSLSMPLALGALTCFKLIPAQEDSFMRGFAKHRREEFGTAMMFNNYCGTDETHAKSKCILCREESECLEGELCIPLESCEVEQIQIDNKPVEDKALQQTGYCAPDWINAAKCLHYDFPCSSDSDCGTEGHSCFYSISWCLPGVKYQTYFCGTDLTSAQDCDLSRLCKSENDTCLVPGETCMEVDFCNVVAFDTTAPTQSPTSETSSSETDTKESDAVEPTQSPATDGESEESPPSQGSGTSSSNALKAGNIITLLVSLPLFFVNFMMS